MFICMCTVELSKQSVIVICYSDTYHYYSDYVGKISPNKPFGFPVESSVKGLSEEKCSNTVKM